MVGASSDPSTCATGAPEADAAKGTWGCGGGIIGARADEGGGRDGEGSSAWCARLCATRRQRLHSGWVPSYDVMNRAWHRTQATEASMKR